jgi:hypothetical protein
MSIESMAKPNQEPESLWLWAKARIEGVLWKASVPTPTPEWLPTEPMIRVMRGTPPNEWWETW